MQELERERSEPIAIIGIGCRVPGAGEGVEGYWKLLVEGRVAVSDGVEKRFADVERATRLPESARWAGLLEQIDQFDPQHFGISPREAAGIDPQQRMLLETSWQAARGCQHRCVPRCTNRLPESSSASARTTTRSCSCRIRVETRSIPILRQELLRASPPARIAYVLGLKRADGFDRHRLLLVSCRIASSLRRHSQPRMHYRIGWRSEPDPGARIFDRLRGGRHVVAAWRLQDV